MNSRSTKLWWFVCLLCLSLFAARAGVAAKNPFHEARVRNLLSGLKTTDAHRIWEILRELEDMDLISSVAESMSEEIGIAVRPHLEGPESLRARYILKVIGDSSSEYQEYLINWIDHYTDYRSTADNYINELAKVKNLTDKS
ncbi:MAG: hypothetical protein HY537_16560 [Deltaproteobacteria bacterium]|nr:hypothetical protein [Deltaproteobacteria bacterium]